MSWVSSSPSWLLDVSLLHLCLLSTYYVQGIGLYDFRREKSSFLFVGSITFPHPLLLLGLRHLGAPRRPDLEQGASKASLLGAFW